MEWKRSPWSSGRKMKKKRRRRRRGRGGGGGGGRKGGRKRRWRRKRPITKENSWPCIREKERKAICLPNMERRHCGQWILLKGLLSLLLSLLLLGTRNDYLHGFKPCLFKTKIRSSHCLNATNISRILIHLVGVIWKKKVSSFLAGRKWLNFCKYPKSKVLNPISKCRLFSNKSKQGSCYSTDQYSHATS